MSATRQQYVVRPATDADLDRIVEFEIEIAKASFEDEAVVDPAVHRKRVAGSLGKAGETTLVVATTADPAAAIGWGWLSARTNSLTGARYGNFRSLAVADVPGRSEAAEALLAALVGKVSARNLGMRTLYRKFGFEAAHLTMRRRTATR
jgi:hypothetical protein